jgi:hypothetical protein
VVFNRVATKDRVLAFVAQARGTDLELFHVFNSVHGINPQIESAGSKLA